MPQKASGLNLLDEDQFLRRSSLLFAGMVFAFSAWILSLPIVPTQDGPMHRYYIHVLDAVLHHSTLYSVYQVRHPFPPYATHYGLLLALSHIVSFDVAEKLFTVLIVVCFAYGLRFCAMGCGRAGNVISFFSAPLFLHWALMMGFMNYSLALGIFLFIAGCWQRATAGQLRYWALFCLLVCLLTVTHPVPLLILIALCTLDLLLRALLLNRRMQNGAADRNSTLDYALHGRTIVLAAAALVFCFLAFQMPAASLQKHAAGSVFASIGFHSRLNAQMALLAGVSPFYTVTHSLLPNLYRLILYAIFIGALLLAAHALRQHWSNRQFRFSDTFFLSVLLLAPALTILPDYVNGSGFFSTRMVVLLWVGLLIAASGNESLSLPRRRALLWGALLCAAVTLLTAQIYFRPVANELARVERQPIPQNRQALVLTGPDLDTYVHRHYQVAFDPFAWGTALAFVHSNDVILDSPWIDQNIAPLQAVPGSPLMIDDIRMTHMSQTDPGVHPGASLPRSKEHALVQASQVILYSDTPTELDKGLTDQLTVEDAARYGCSRQSWYLVCVSK